MSKSGNGSGNNASSKNSTIPSFQKATRINKDDSSINPIKKLLENHVKDSENIANVVKSQEKSSGNTSGSKNMNSTTDKFAKPNQKKCSLSLIADDLFFQVFDHKGLITWLQRLNYLITKAWLLDHKRLITWLQTLDYFITNAWLLDYERLITLSQTLDYLITNAWLLDYKRLITWSQTLDYLITNA